MTKETFQINFAWPDTSRLIKLSMQEGYSHSGDSHLCSKPVFSAYNWRQVFISPLQIFSLIIMYCLLLVSSLVSHCPSISYMWYIAVAHTRFCQTGRPSSLPFHSIPLPSLYFPLPLPFGPLPISHVLWSKFGFKITNVLSAKLIFVYQVVYNSLFLWS